MYTYKKKSEVAYEIVLKDKSIGNVLYKKAKWEAAVGNVTYSAKTRKKAVDQVLFMIIMNYAGPLHREKNKNQGYSTEYEQMVHHLSVDIKEKLQDLVGKE